jgi:hypothetical protein
VTPITIIEAMLRRTGTLSIIVAVVLALTDASAQTPAQSAAPADCSPAAGVQVCVGSVAPRISSCYPTASGSSASAYSAAGGIFAIRTSDKMSTQVYPSPRRQSRFDAKRPMQGCPDLPTRAAQREIPDGQVLSPSSRNANGCAPTLRRRCTARVRSVEMFRVGRAQSGLPSLTWIGLRGLHRCRSA